MKPEPLKGKREYIKDIEERQSNNDPAFTINESYYSEEYIKSAIEGVKLSLCKRALTTKILEGTCDKHNACPVCNEINEWFEDVIEK